jgi:hypothetical protein
LLYPIVLKDCTVQWISNIQHRCKCNVSLSRMYGKMTEWSQNNIFKYLVVLQEDISPWNSRLQTAQISFLFCQNSDLQTLLISVLQCFGAFA